MAWISPELLESATCEAPDVAKEHYDIQGQVAGGIEGKGRKHGWACTVQ